MIRKYISRQFALFLLTSGFAAVVNFGSRIVYNRWTSFSVAVVLAYLTGMVTAFVLNKAFVFKESTTPIHHSIGYFVLVNLAAIAQTYVISVGLHSYVLPWMGVTWHPAEVAHAIGVAAPAVTSYIGHKKLTFR